MINIIHLSDFHLESENLSLDKSNLLKALIIDLEKYVCNNTIIIFSGDLIDKSGVDFKDKELAFNYFQEYFLDPITNKYPKLEGKIFFVPGNHDLDRSDLDKFTDFPKRQNFIENPHLVDEYVNKVKKDKTTLKGLKNYKDFEFEYFKKHHIQDNWQWSQFDNTFKIVIDGKKIGISCLNSSWLCFDNDDQNKLFISTSQIESSLLFIEDCEIKIAVIHHPLETYHEKDIESTKILLYRDYDILLMGHTHKLEGKNVDDIDGSLFLSIGKSISAHKSKEYNYQCGYSIIELYPQDKFKVNYRKYIENKTTFVSNTDIGNDTGIKDFFILKGENLKIFEYSKSIIETIKKDYYPKLNEDLILNISQSNKNSLSEIFVEPIIGNLPESNLEEQDDLSYFTTNDLTSVSKNFLIMGAKDIGKTILLDKLLIDFTELYGVDKRLPILIKFREVNNKNPFQIVREFILKSSEETREILSNKELSLILLIDDIDFSEDYELFLKELKYFLNEYPRTKIIATHSYTDEEIIPIKTLESFSKIITEFEPLYIHHLKAKQIKGLISNWVAIGDQDVHQNIEKLIKGFSELGLPKTPLAVTLFLWIINKQEKKPINNAVLVELFIENLLEKGNIKNIYFDTFDFGDKQRLLSFISKYMLDTGTKNFSYSVNQYDLLKYIQNYLKLKMDISPEKILEYFITRGVLSKCNGSGIRFKSAFFFNYFLAKYMTFDSEFKNNIFSNKNYLEYIDEIDFYTGLNREDNDVFNFIIKELSDTFAFVNANIREGYDKIDLVLETEQTVASKIDLASVRNKPSESQIEAAYDNQMSSIPSKTNIEAKKEVVQNEEEPSLSKILKLAAIVLKNSSDISPEKRKSAYDQVILSSISFMLLYRDALLIFYSKNKDEAIKFIPKKMNFNFFMTVLPIIHQVTMYNWIGSLKIAPIIRQKINEDVQSLNISEFERFLSVYIYSDIRGRDHDTFIDNLFKQTKKRYILDASFIKNMTYYHLRSKSKESDDKYTKLLADIKVKLNEVDKSKKGQYILQLKDKKKNL